MNHTHPSDKPEILAGTSPSLRRLLQVMMLLATSASAALVSAQPSQPIVLPPYSPGHPAPVMVLSGIESPKLAPSGAPAVDATTTVAAIHTAIEPVAPSTLIAAPTLVVSEPVLVSASLPDDDPAPRPSEAATLRRTDRPAPARERRPGGGAPRRDEQNADAGRRPASPMRERWNAAEERFQPAEAWGPFGNRTDRRDDARPASDAGRNAGPTPRSNWPEDADALMQSPTIRRILDLTEENIRLGARLEIAEIQHQHQAEIREIELRHMREELERAVDERRRTEEELRRAEAEIRELRSQTEPGQHHAESVRAENDTLRRRTEEQQALIEALRQESYKLSEQLKFRDEKLERLNAQSTELKALAEARLLEAKERAARMERAADEFQSRAEARLREAAEQGALKDTEIEAGRNERRELEHRARTLEARAQDLEAQLKELREQLQANAKDQKDKERKDKQREDRNEDN